MEAHSENEGGIRAGDWREFLKALQSLYRHAESLKLRLDVMTEEESESPLGLAVQKELAETLAEALCREFFIDECHRKGMHVPNIIRRPGNA
jgi:hypothetical protein